MKKEILVDETTNPAPPSDPTLNDTQNAVPTDSAEAARVVTDALGDSIVPDRIRARDPQPEATPEPTTVVENPVVEAPATEPVSETAELAPTPVEETVEEEEPQEYVPPAQSAPIIDPKAFADENGYVDVSKLTDAINNAIQGVQQTASVTAQRELAANRAEERQWNQATEKFPELKTDRTLRDFVQQARVGRATEAYRNAGNDPARLAAVKIPTPYQMAKELFDRIGKAKSEGVKAATETTEVAQSNVLPTSGTAAPTTSKREQLFSKIRDPRDRIGAEKAQTELLKDLLFSNNE
jgi:hypothetical protein